MTDDKYEAAKMQAECVVAAIDNYLATMPWPAPTLNDQSYQVPLSVRRHAREFLVMTIAASLRMSESRKNPLQNP